TDTYYRWSAFSQPQRHVKVVQKSEMPMMLLTAFGPKLEVQSKANVHTGKLGDIAWTALVGGGSEGGLESDAHLAIAVHNAKTGTTEVMRFGGKTLVWKGVKVEATSEDAFAVLRDGK